MTAGRSLRAHFGEFVGDAVFGAHDGLITTFAVISGVSGADLAGGVAIVLGVANLLADGVSMAAGNYLARRSEQAYEDRDADSTAVADGRDGRVPLIRSGIIFASFAVIGGVPLLPFLFMDADDAYLVAVGLTLATLFAVGSLRTLVTGGSWAMAGLEMFALGSVAAAIAYGVGVVLGGVA